MIEIKLLVQAQGSCASRRARGKLFPASALPRINPPPHIGSHVTSGMNEPSMDVNIAYSMDEQYFFTSSRRSIMQLKYLECY